MSWNTASESGNSGVRNAGNTKMPGIAPVFSQATQQYKSSLHPSMQMYTSTSKAPSTQQPQATGYGAALNPAAELGSASLALRASSMSAPVRDTAPRGQKLAAVDILNEMDAEGLSAGAQAAMVEELTQLRSVRTALEQALKSERQRYEMNKKKLEDTEDSLVVAEMEMKAERERVMKEGANKVAALKADREDKVQEMEAQQASYAAKMNAKTKEVQAAVTAKTAAENEVSRLRAEIADLKGAVSSGAASGTGRHGGPRTPFGMGTGGTGSVSFPGTGRGAFSAAASATSSPSGMKSGGVSSSRVALVEGVHVPPAPAPGVAVAAEGQARPARGFGLATALPASAASEPSSPSLLSSLLSESRAGRSHATLLTLLGTGLAKECAVLQGAATALEAEEVLLSSPSRACPGCSERIEAAVCLCVMEAAPGVVDEAEMLASMSRGAASAAGREMGSLWTPSKTINTSTSTSTSNAPDVTMAVTGPTYAPVLDAMSTSLTVDGGRGSRRGSLTMADLRVSPGILRQRAALFQAPLGTELLSRTHSSLPLSGASSMHLAGSQPVSAVQQQLRAAMHQLQAGAGSRASTEGVHSALLSPLLTLCGLAGGVMDLSKLSALHQLAGLRVVLQVLNHLSGQAQPAESGALRSSFVALLVSTAGMLPIMVVASTHASAECAKLSAGDRLIMQEASVNLSKRSALLCSCALVVCASPTLLLAKRLEGMETALTGLFSSCAYSLRHCARVLRAWLKVDPRRLATASEIMYRTYGYSRRPQKHAQARKFNASQGASTAQTTPAAAMPTGDAALASQCIMPGTVALSLIPSIAQLSITVAEAHLFRAQEPVPGGARSRQAPLPFVTWEVLGAMSSHVEACALALAICAGRGDARELAAVAHALRVVLKAINVVARCHGNTGYAWLIGLNPTKDGNSGSTGSSGGAGEVGGGSGRKSSGSRAGKAGAGTVEGGMDVDDRAAQAGQTEVVGLVGDADVSCLLPRILVATTQCAEVMAVTMSHCEEEGGTEAVVGVQAVAEAALEACVLLRVLSQLPATMPLLLPGATSPASILQASLHAVTCSSRMLSHALPLPHGLHASDMPTWYMACLRPAPLLGSEPTDVDIEGLEERAAREGMLLMELLGQAVDRLKGRAAAVGGPAGSATTTPLPRSVAAACVALTATRDVWR